jgi:hypothetical protein
MALLEEEFFAEAPLAELGALVEGEELAEPLLDEPQATANAATAARDKPRRALLENRLIPTIFMTGPPI